MRYAIVMAGGSGERFFPLSRQRRPKQLLPLLGDGTTLLEHTIRRCIRVVPAENVLVITSPLLRDTIAEMLAATLPAENIVAEPAKRNTAGCLVLGASLIALRDRDAVVAALPADHYIGDDELFAEQLASALDFAASHELIVTFGMNPTRPETGYGYIEIGEPIADGFYRVVSFREKPDSATAQRFVEAGRFLWNGGMFVYRADVFARQLQLYAPEFGAALAPLTAALAHGDRAEVSELFGALPNISIDYALMERTPAIAVARARFPWDDLGAWDALERIARLDEHGNVTIGTTVALDSTDTTLANYAERPMLLCALGVDGIVAVVTDDVVMLCRRDNVQQVRRIVEHLRSNGQEQWL